MTHLTGRGFAAKGLFGTLLCALLLVASTASAQRAGNQGDDAEAQGQGEARITPTIRTQIYDRLAEAQVCAEADDPECAIEILNQVLSRNRDLNTYETAQVHNIFAYVYFDVDRFDDAISSYETILSLPREDLPDGIIQSTMRNLATLYLQVDRLRDGLDLFLQWMDLPTTTPSSQDYYILATVYYQLEEFEQGIPAIEQAIALARERGEFGDEAWFQLLYVFYFELGNVPKVIETLTILVENFTKRDHMVALAGQYSQRDQPGDQERTLTLFDAAYEQGWLERGSDLVTLANMHLQAGAPFRAAKIIEAGLEEGAIEENERNYNLLAQAWQLAKEDELAIPALITASRLSDSGQIDSQLAQSYMVLARWEDCVEAARAGLERGGVSRPDYTNIMLGRCLVNLKRYDEALEAFRTAARDERSTRDANLFIRFVQEAQASDRANREALASIERQRNR
ncbi:MAG: hypothetical protein R3305_02840 [Gammaproteobacteria bacterium]|nr:hypothetical protein [Gammaproteobacteria bacterium]